MVAGDRTDRRAVLLSASLARDAWRDVAEPFAWAVGLSVASIAFSLSIFAHAAVPRPAFFQVPLLTILRVPGLLWICIAGPSRCRMPW